MQVQIIATESRKGTSKKTGEPYQINMLTCLIPIPETKKEITNENNVLTSDGMRVWIVDIDNDNFDKVKNNTTGSWPLIAEIETEQDTDRDNNMRTVVTSLTFDNY